jgi:tetratricopeptide (TPR) repeat protein
MNYIPAYIHKLYPVPPANPDYEMMARACHEALDTHPEDRDHLLAYEAIYLGYCGKRKEAVEHCRHFLPTIKNKECAEDMGRTLVYNLEQIGDLRAAVEALEAQIETAKFKSSVYDDIVEYAVKLKDNDLIIKYSLLWIEEDDYVETEVYERLANAYDEKRDYLKSYEYFEKAAQNVNDETSWLWNNAGRALALAGRQDEAMFYFQMVLKIKPDSEFAHYYMGQSYQTKGDVYRALHHYTEALKIRPDFSEVHNNMAALSFEEESDIPAAIKHLEQALESNPPPHMLTLLYTNLSRLYHKIADYDKHEYYKGKLLESIGFDVDFGEDDDDDPDEEDDDFSLN